MHALADRRKQAEATILATTSVQLTAANHTSNIFPQMQTPTIIHTIIIYRLQNASSKFARNWNYT